MFCLGVAGLPPLGVIHKAFFARVRSAAAGAKRETEQDMT